MENPKHMSDSILVGIILALSGGFMDAYSYMCRDKVFANAQTGNMLLFGIHVSENNYGQALRYLFPVVAFAAGIAVAEIAHLGWKKVWNIHWRQIAVFIEAVILFAVAFIPLSQNLLANSLTSFACGIQVESFRKIRGNAIATTMCIGNLRSGTQNFCEYLYTKDSTKLEKGFLYAGIITCFIIGAVLGDRFVDAYGTKAIMMCSAFLLLASFVMLLDGKKEQD